MENFVLELLLGLGIAVREKVYSELKRKSSEDLSAIYKEAEDDTIYQIDRNVEEIIVPLLEEKANLLGGIFLLAEGIGDPNEGLFLGIRNGGQPTWALIIDPIDGTRGIMYNKRSAFFLAGAAPFKENLKLSDIVVASMTELPTSKMLFSDVLFAIKGKGCQGERHNLITNDRTVLPVKPSASKDLLGGFGQIARFFPPGRALLAQIEDEMIEILYPDAVEGKTLVFEDQYISSGGQLYEILMGHDRYVADIRDVLFSKMAKDGKKKGHICHPYDVCTFLIGKEAGVQFTDSFGNNFDAPLNLLADVGWIAYCNSEIRALVEPVLLERMKFHGLIS
jgi:hypothetical protein